MKQIVRRRRGETDLMERGGIMDQIYRCSGQSYWINEETCNARQERGFRPCSRCSVRCGGIDDPRTATITKKGKA